MVEDIGKPIARTVIHDRDLPRFPNGKGRKIRSRNFEKSEIVFGSVATNFAGTRLPFARTTICSVESATT